MLLIPQTSLRNLSAKYVKARPPKNAIPSLLKKILIGAALYLSLLEIKIFEDHHPKIAPLAKATTKKEISFIYSLAYPVIHILSLFLHLGQ